MKYSAGKEIGMGYSIHYENGNAIHKETKKVSAGGKGILKCLAVLLLGFCLIYCYNIRDRLQRVFAPQNLSSAVKQSVDALQNGEPFREAVDVFCDELYEGTLIKFAED